MFMCGNKKFYVASGFVLLARFSWSGGLRWKVKVIDWKPPVIRQHEHVNPFLHLIN